MLQYPIFNNASPSPSPSGMRYSHSHESLFRLKKKKTTTFITTNKKLLTYSSTGWARNSLAKTSRIFSPTQRPLVNVVKVKSSKVVWTDFTETYTKKQNKIKSTNRDDQQRVEKALTHSRTFLSEYPSLFRDGRLSIVQSRYCLFSLIFT